MTEKKHNHFEQINQLERHQLDLIEEIEAIEGSSTGTRIEEIQHLKKRSFAILDEIQNLHRTALTESVDIFLSDGLADAKTNDTELSETKDAGERK